MRIDEFTSGRYEQQYQHKSFMPSLVNVEWTWDDSKINTLLEQATRALGELNAFSVIVPNIDMYIYMHVVKEANASSKIEGTKTELDEALLEEESTLPERRIMEPNY